MLKQNRKVMARIKDLIIDLQNEYGYDMEFLPEDFNMDEYLAKRASEIEEELLIKVMEPTRIFRNGGIGYLKELFGN